MDLYRDREQYLPPAGGVAKVMFSALCLSFCLFTGVACGHYPRCIEKGTHEAKK